MGKVYSRNVAQKQICVSEFPQKIPNGRKDADSLPNELPEFAEISQGDGASINNEVHGKSQLVGKCLFWETENI